AMNHTVALAQLGLLVVAFFVVGVILSGTALPREIADAETTSISGGDPGYPFCCNASSQNVCVGCQDSFSFWIAVPRDTWIACDEYNACPPENDCPKPGVGSTCDAPGV